MTKYIANDHSDCSEQADTTDYSLPFDAEDDFNAIHHAIKKSKTLPVLLGEEVQLIGLSKLVEVPLRKGINGEIIPWNATSEEI